MSLLKRLGTTQDLSGTSQKPPPCQSSNQPGRTSGLGGSQSGNGQQWQTPDEMSERTGSGDLGAIRRPSIGTQQSTGTHKSDNFNELKSRIQNPLTSELDPRMDLGNQEEVRRTVEETFASVLESENIVLTRVERMRLFEAISAEILGYGPIEPLLKDESVSEVMDNGPRQTYVERAGRLERNDITFQDDDHFMRVIDRIVSPLGRRIDESSPMVDARLPDGSRINAVIPPISLVGPAVPRLLDAF
jgi:pilus assembly protein CpaF